MGELTACEPIPLVLTIARRFTWETRPRLSAPCVTRNRIFASDGRALFMARNPGIPPSGPHDFPRDACEKYAALARKPEPPFATVRVVDLMAALYREAPATRACEDCGEAKHAAATSGADFQVGPGDDDAAFTVCNGAFETTRGRDKGLALYAADPWLLDYLANPVVTQSSGAWHEMLVTAHYFSVCVEALRDLGEESVRLCRVKLTKKRAAHCGFCPVEDSRPLLFVGERAGIILMPRTRP